MKPKQFKTFEFNFEIARLMWLAPFGGADYGEVWRATQDVRDGDYESWHQAWVAAGERLAARAGNLPRAFRAGALWRASRYFAAAEFFLNPKDARKILAYQRSCDLFYQGLELSGAQFERHDVQLGGAISRTLFFPVEGARGTIFACTGFDGTLEELYFLLSESARANIYNLVLYEGFGQADILRYQGVAFRADWHAAARPVVDFYTDLLGELGEKVGIGLSLGGLLVARAAAADGDLFDKLVLFNYCAPFLEMIKHALPLPFRPVVERGLPRFLEPIAEFYARSKPFLNWQTKNAKWTFGARGMRELIEVARDFNEEIAAKNLKTDCLILLAKDDNYYDYHLGERFFAQIPAKNKKLVLFDSATNNSSLHCQVGASFESLYEIFTWLDES